VAKIDKKRVFAVFSLVKWPKKGPKKGLFWVFFRKKAEKGRIFGVKNVILV
jgi:hypothetical protein